MRKNVIIFSGEDAAIRKAIANIDEMQFTFTETPVFANETDCVLISQDFAGDALVEIVKNLKSRLIPTAVITSDLSADNQEFLLECGADDILPLPLHTRLLIKRIYALTGRPELTADHVDFAAFDRILEANRGAGSFIVEEHDFTNMYRFVSRLLERLDQKAQLVIFDFDSELGIPETASVYDFIKIVRTVLRRGDISSICGHQVLVILMGSDEAGGKVAVKRMIDTFDAHFNDGTCDISYQIREVNPER